MRVFASAWKGDGAVLKRIDVNEATGDIDSFQDEAAGWFHFTADVLGDRDGKVEVDQLAGVRGNGEGVGCGKVIADQAANGASRDLGIMVAELDGGHVQHSGFAGEWFV